jgi:polyisoprenyl-phosphate glycosyltransferase
VAEAFGSSASSRTLQLSPIKCRDGQGFRKRMTQSPEIAGTSARSKAPLATPKVSLVIPMYNEAPALDILFARLDRALPRPDARHPHSYVFEIVCVNDGSRDDTLDRLKHIASKRSDLVVVDLSRNFGKEAALSAGLAIASGDALIPIDADLQDPPELIASLLEKWREGYEVVLARRSDRSTDSAAKRWTAQSFYRVHNAVSDVEIPPDVGDFRLMDRVVVDALNALPESRRFMKGLFAWVGFKTTSIDYARESRSAGETKFNAWKLWNFAIEGIAGFSISPLKIWTYLGALVAVAAMGWGGWIAIRTLAFGVDVPGYASLLVAVLFLGGLQLIGIGMIGEYLGRAFIESKRRPAYLVREVIRSHGLDKRG